MVLVNGRFMTQNLTGVQRYARGIARELLAIRDDVHIVVPSSARVLSEYSDLPFTRIGHLRGHSWEQVSLRRHAHRSGEPLVNLASTGPAWYRDQLAVHHDITYIRYPESFAWSFRLLYHWVVPGFLRSARAVITVSQFSRVEIAQHFGIDVGRIHVIPNAVDSHFSPGERPGDVANYLLAVSSPSAHKNFSRLIAAYETLDLETRPRLKIVGGAAHTLRQSDLRRPPGVEFLGRLDEAELVSLYRGAIAFVFPSLYEGFGIPPLEAQACGTAVVAAATPIASEVLGESALTFDPRDVAALADSMTRVIADDDLRAQLISAGTENVARFSWRDSAEALSRLIDDTFAPAPRRGATS